MAQIRDATPMLLREFLAYDPETGLFVWRWREAQWFSDGNQTAEANRDVWNKRRAGTQAFTAINSNGYKLGAIFNRSYFAHRVAWAITHGVWPDGQVDHINRDRSDNRLENLRMATPAQNQYNTAISSRNTSGFKGVSFYGKTGTWSADIAKDGISYHLGRFPTAEEAYMNYCIAAERLHGNFNPSSLAMKQLKATVNELLAMGGR